MEKSMIKKKQEDAADPKKRIVYYKVAIKQWNVDCFFKIIDTELDEFLKNDRCCKLADNYLIAVTFMYFLRASFRREEYTTFNFYVALYLAHDMEEDEGDKDVDLPIWSPAGPGGLWTPMMLARHSALLFKRMDYRAVVSRASCDSLMKIARPDHPVWQRNRPKEHGGASPRYQKSERRCPKCPGYTRVFPMLSNK